MDVNCTTLSYGKHASHKYDLYHTQKMIADDFRNPLICFVHGGAWTLVNPTDDPNMTRCAEDVLLGLEFLQDQPTGHVPYDPTKIYLIGHGCGVHIIKSILLGSIGVTSSLMPSPELMSSIQAVVLSEGFQGSKQQLPTLYKNGFVASKNSNMHLGVRAEGSHVRWLVVHPGKTQHGAESYAVVGLPGYEEPKWNRDGGRFEVEMCCARYGKDLPCEGCMGMLSQFIVNDTWAAGDGQY